MSNGREVLKFGVRETEGTWGFGMSTSKSLILYIVILLLIFMYKDYDQKQLGSKEFLWLTSYNPLSGEYKVRNQGINLYVGTEVETMEKCCLLACSPWLALV